MPSTRSGSRNQDTLREEQHILPGSDASRDGGRGRVGAQRKGANMSGSKAARQGSGPQVTAARGHVLEGGSARTHDFSERGASFHLTHLRGGNLLSVGGQTIFLPQAGSARRMDSASSCQASASRAVGQAVLLLPRGRHLSSGMGSVQMALPHIRDRSPASSRSRVMVQAARNRAEEALRLVYAEKP